MHPYLMPSLELTPNVLDRLVALVPADRYDELTDPSRFTLREAIAHMADWEPIFLERIQAGVNQPGAEVQGMDESKRAVDQKYEDWDLQESLQKFRRARTATIAYLYGLTPEQWQTQVTHNEKGLMTAYDQANMLLGHDIYHIEHASQFVAQKVAGTW